MRLAPVPVTATATVALLFLSWTSLWSPEAVAQAPLQMASERPMPPPALMVRVADRSTPLQLTEVKAEVTVVGHLAETEMTMTFYNPNRRVMEGDLYFPLPQGVARYSRAL
ncbi:MAG: VIT domain-containing protein, partial [Myxococcota bacterium]